MAVCLNHLLCRQKAYAVDPRHGRRWIEIVANRKDEALNWPGICARHGDARKQLMILVRIACSRVDQAQIIISRKVSPRAYELLFQQPSWNGLRNHMHFTTECWVGGDKSIPHQFALHNEDPSIAHIQAEDHP